MGTLLDLASLVVVPSGYKEDVVYSVKPTDGSGDLDFTRSNDTATRVNSAGLIEKVRTNLVLQSNTFDTTWVSAGGGTTTATIGATDPFGGATAWTLAKTGAAGRIEQFPTLSGQVTLSIYAKAGTLNWITFGNDVGGIYCNLNTGAVTLNSAGGSAVSVGNGWYRITLTTATNGNAFRIYPADGDGNVSGTSGNVLIYAAQMESGDIATDYISTTSAAVSVGMTANVPRLDYSGGGCPKLLLEPQRTNLALYSEQFDNAAWGKDEISVTANTATAPDNTVSADKIIPSTSSSGHHLTETVTGAAHSFSVFAKSGGYSTLNILYTVHNSYATFNLSDGTITETNGTATAKIENYGNGWYRCTVSTSSTTHTEVRIYAINGTTFADVNTPGNGTDGILVWGAQLEVGSYATSYIPTLAAASTRGADASFKTGISSLIGQTEGTMFAEFTIPETQSPSFFSISDGTSANRIIFGYYLGVVRYYTSSTTGSFSSAGIIDAAPVVGQTYKIAIGYKANDFKVYKNGSNTNTETTYTVPASLTALDNEGGNAGQNIYAGVKQLLLFPTRLSNTQLAELTTI